MADFGILNTNSIPRPSTSLISTPNTALQNEQGLLQGIQALQEAQRTAIQSRESQANIAMKQQQMDMAREEQPYKLGLLGAQIEQSNASTGLLGVQTEGARIKNKSDALAYKEQQYKIEGYHKSVQAYQNAFDQTGDRQLATQALIDTTMAYNPETAVTIQSNLTALKNAALEGNTKQMVNIGAVVHSAMSTETPLETYKKSYKALKMVAPDAPAPSEFKTDDDFRSYSLGALSITEPFVKKEAAELELIKSDDFAKAQRQRDAKLSALKAVSNNPDATQEEKDKALSDYKESRINLENVIAGKSQNKTPEKIQVAQRVGELKANPKKSAQETAELQSLESQTAPSNDGAIEKNVEYITSLKKAADALPPGSPEQKAAQEKLDFALSQAKQDAGLWSKIKDKIAGAIGSAVGSVANTLAPPAASDPFAAELQRRQGKP